MKKEMTPRFAIIALLGFGVAGVAFASNRAVAEGRRDFAQTAVTNGAVPASSLNNEAPDIAYKGPVFSGFIAESYQQSPDPNRPEFYAWMQNEYENSKVRFKTLEDEKSLDGLLAAIHQKYAATTDPEARTLLEKQTGGFCHKLIKKTVKHFSLDHGFEFYNMVDHGQRQCFLQATVIAGLMDRAGMSAGVVMVTKSDKGEESNNGHAVTLVKLSNGKDLLVDASHKSPFVKQQGLMVADVATGSYRFVAPQYAEKGDQIEGYVSMSAGGASIASSSVRPLSIAFMKSQFDYYRGERTPGGFFDKKKSEQGLADSERFFTRSIQEDPANPLPAYALGRVELRRGQNDLAKRQILAAYQLYNSYGYIPDGENEALTLIKAPPTTPALSMR